MLGVGQSGLKEIPRDAYGRYGPGMRNCKWGSQSRELITGLAVPNESVELQEIDVPAIIMWLLGVPLIVIVLLYLVF